LLDSNIFQQITKTPELKRKVNLNGVKSQKELNKFNDNNYDSINPLTYNEILNNLNHNQMTVVESKTADNSPYKRTSKREKSKKKLFGKDILPAANPLNMGINVFENETKQQNNIRIVSKNQYLGNLNTFSNIENNYVPYIPNTNGNNNNINYGERMSPFNRKNLDDTLSNRRLELDKLSFALYPKRIDANIQPIHSEPFVNEKKYDNYPKENINTYHTSPKVENHNYKVKQLLLDQMHQTNNLNTVQVPPIYVSDINKARKKDFSLFDPFNEKSKDLGQSSLIYNPILNPLSQSTNDDNKNFARKTHFRTYLRTIGNTLLNSFA